MLVFETSCNVSSLESVLPYFFSFIFWLSEAELIEAAIVGRVNRLRLERFRLAALSL